MAWRDAAVQVLGELYPLSLAEGWDNVGVLVDALGEAKSSVIVITNDLTEEVLDEALAKNASMIVTYHPRPFTSMKRLTRGDVTQRIVLRCIHAGILVYSPHTACDSAVGGVNCWLAEGFPGQVTPVEPTKVPDMPGAGSGRMIQLNDAVSVRKIVEMTKAHVKLPHLRVSLASGLQTRPGPDGFQEGLDKEGVVRVVGVQAGSGGSVLKACKPAQVWVTGEMGHHDVLAAAAEGVTCILTEHTNTERGFLPRMGDQLAKALEAKGHKGVSVHVSLVDADPLNVV